MKLSSPIYCYAATIIGGSVSGGVYVSGDGGSVIGSFIKGSSCGEAIVTGDGSRSVSVFCGCGGRCVSDSDSGSGGGVSGGVSVGCWGSGNGSGCSVSCGVCDSGGGGSVIGSFIQGSGIEFFLVVMVVDVVLVVLRVIVLVRVVVVVEVVVPVVVDVMVVLVVTFDRPHFQQLPYILSYAIMLKLNLMVMLLSERCSCDHSIDRQAVVAKRNENIYIYIYYIDSSVLLENIPLVKFIKTISGTRVVYFP